MQEDKGSRNKYEGDAFNPPMRRRDEPYRDCKVRVSWWTRTAAITAEKRAPAIIQRIVDPSEHATAHPEDWVACEAAVQAAIWG